MLDKLMGLILGRMDKVAKEMNQLKDNYLQIME